MSSLHTYLPYRHRSNCATVNTSPHKFSRMHTPTHTLAITRTHTHRYMAAPCLYEVCHYLCVCVRTPLGLTSEAREPSIALQYNHATDEPANATEKRSSLLCVTEWRQAEPKHARQQTHAPTTDARRTPARSHSVPERRVRTSRLIVCVCVCVPPPTPLSVPKTHTQVRNYTTGTHTTQQKTIILYTDLLSVQRTKDRVRVCVRVCGSTLVRILSACCCCCCLACVR